MSAYLNDPGFHDYEAVHGGEALPYDFSNTKYSYMHGPEEEAGDRGREERRANWAEPDEVGSRNLARGAGSFMQVRSDGELRAELRAKDVE